MMTFKAGGGSSLAVLEHGVDLFDVFVRDPAALVFIEDHLPELFEVGVGNGVQGGPFLLGFEAGLEGPIASVFMGADEAEFAVLGAVSPFVSDHGRRIGGSMGFDR
jgi:hypothetical protein